MSAEEIVAAATVLKDEGNALFAAKDFEEAIAKYSEGIKLIKPLDLDDPSGDSDEDAEMVDGAGAGAGAGDGDGGDRKLKPVGELRDTARSVKCVLYANRAAAFMGVSRYVPACRDAIVAGEVDDTYWKAFWRQGIAMMSMAPKRFRTQQAIKAFEHCLECPSLPDMTRPAVNERLRQAQMIYAKQDAETPMPEMPEHCVIC